MNIRVLTLMAMACLAPGLQGQTNTIPGPNYERLVQQSTDCDGTMFGLNEKGLIFAWNGVGWTQVEGELKQISVGSKSEVWGVNSLNQVWKLTATGWQRMPGTMTQVAVLKGGKGVVAIDAAGKSYSWDPTPDASGSGTWKTFAQQPTLVAIDAGTGIIAGLGRQREIYIWRPGRQEWRTFRGELEKISVGCDDSIGGVNSGNAWVRTNADIVNELQNPTAPSNWVPVVQSAQDLTIIDNQTSLILNQQNLVVQYDATVITLDGSLKTSPIYQTQPTITGQSTDSPYVCPDSQVAMTGVLKLNIPNQPQPDHICLSFIGAGEFKAIPQVPPARTVVRGLSTVFGVTGEESQPATQTLTLAQAVAAGATSATYYVARPARALGPVACDPRTFNNLSNHSWVEFRLPAGMESQQISIPAGSYNHYVFPACNQVWWDNLTFSCDATQGWHLIQGKYDASAGCSSSPGSSPYVVYGDR